MDRAEQKKTRGRALFPSKVLEKLNSVAPPYLGKKKKKSQKEQKTAG